jgi:hypothetical protein
MGHNDARRQRAGARNNPASVISSVDGASLVLARTGSDREARAQRFANEEKARARAQRLGEGWEAWRAPGGPAWFVRRVARSAYDPATAGATYTVLGPSDEVLARYVTSDGVAAFVRRARGDASVVDDRDGNRVIAGTDGAPETLAMIETLLDDYEASHEVARHVVAYFADSNNPGRALTLDQLDYDPAKNYLDPRDKRAIEALAPGESHRPLPGDSDEGPFYGSVTRLSAATQPKALVRDGVILGVGLDEAEARADAAERCEAEAAGVEVVDATLAALSGWQDDELSDRVYFAPDGTARRIDVFDVLPHDDGTPNDPRWYTDEDAESDDGDRELGARVDG